MTDLNECLVNICQHGGSCLNTLGSFRCQCLPGWSGQYCERGMMSLLLYIFKRKGPFWSWSYVSWIYNCLCNQCLSPLALWVRIPLRWGVLETTLCDKVCLWLAAGWWFSPGTAVSSTNKTDRHDITEILLKMALV